ncbi:SAM-dependent methyltransferase [Marinicella sp. S1101]|uniref:class I SAM-dependent methyltransferase n=1 Tax=Marinicella marina TaxID=2996016 RepID=UPI002260A1CE|nr:SAM-dependent methyltransferase [Marinicella marina]MCX7552322.1 SAM-dependent methyltransferase [Marinicella marina]MDJ1139197.1 SAM-dependent methyltransferase [Marinicella marina]
MSDSLEKIKSSLQHKISTQIKQKGAISFAEFMRMALYEPGLGYYSAGLHKFGKAGDFVTSSELGDLFAQCHASCFAEILPTISSPVIFELGAGSGQFCVDVLLALDELNCLPDAYWIFEVSGALKQTQQEAVKQLPAALADRVKWLHAPPDEVFNGIIYANEVLDALPVEVFRFKHDQYQRLMLTDEAGQLTETWDDFPADLSAQLTQKELQLAAGYRSEFIPNLSAWFASVVKNLQQGAVLMVDYGYGRPTYYHPQRHTGTLVCHRRHQANFNPYQDVGLQDITAFVDFTAVAEAMESVGLTVCGFTNQADFLLNNGIDKHLDADGEYQTYFQQVTEMKQLVMPEEMGEKFKVIAAHRNLPLNLSGFSVNYWQTL